MADPDFRTNTFGVETLSMVVWPSMAAYPLGRQVGQLCGISIGAGKFFTVGKLMALVTIPVSLVLFFWRLAPVVARRYVLTDRRVVVLRGLGGECEAGSVGLDGFDRIDVQVLSGQAFFRAGDLIFLDGSKEVLRLAGVQHPEGFRQACLRGRDAMLQVERVVVSQERRVAAAAVAE